MVSRADACARARQRGWLSRLSPERQAALLDTARIVQLDAGALLYNLGDPPGGMFGLVAGCVAAEAAQSDRPPQKGLLLHAVAWFGEGPLVGQPSRVVGIRATRPCTILSIEASAMHAIVRRDPEVWRDIARLAVENQLRVIGLAEDLMLRGSRERLAAILVRLAGLRDPEPPDQATVDATQTEIAAIANLSRSVVSDLLPKMERAGFVTLGRASVTIRDPAGLLGPA